MIVLFFLYSDVNECDEQTSNCVQVCTNNVGSYECSCYSGYTYGSVANTCTLGKLQPKYWFKQYLFEKFYKYVIYRVMGYDLVQSTKACRDHLLTV